MPIWLTLAILYIANLIGLFCVAVVGARKPALTLTWVFIGLILPFLGIVLYFVFQYPVSKRSPLPWELSADTPVTMNGSVPSLPASLSTTAIRTAVSHFSSTPTVAHISAYHAGEDFYHDLLKALYAAQTSIDVEFYIFRYDDVGREVVEALLERAKAGVKVRFLRDGFGSKEFPSSVVSDMIRSGIDCRVHFPIRFPYITPRANHRDHCKIVIIDEITAFTGGINVGIEYASRNAQYGPWRDSHVRVKSSSRLDLVDLFEANFRTADKDRPDKRNKKQVTMSTAIDPPDPSERQKIHRPRTHQGMVQFLQSGPDTPRQNLRELFFLCLTQAVKQVEITTPYFLPESDLMMALRTAVSRGVRVRLLLPERVDHRVIGLACQTYFPALLQAGVEVYLHRPGVLHAKVMTVDDEIAVVGAANYDIRSFRLNYEVVMLQYGASLVTDLRAQFESDLEVSRRLDADGLHTHLLARAKHNAARLLSPLL